MRDFTDKCVVLKISDYRDDDRLAKVLTAENGMITVLLRGVKKAKAKLKAFAQMFSVFDTRLVSGKGAFLTPVEPLLIQDGFSVSADLKKFTAASVAAEATAASLEADYEPHPEIFLEFLKFLRAIESGVDAYCASATYMLGLLSLSGFYREYGCDGQPKTPVQMLGYMQRNGYGCCEFLDSSGGFSDLSRRALKYVCSEFCRNFDTGLKSIDSIDLYA